ncbi:MAG: ABC transporter permease, partial [Candidatus Heimdallarchaeota archaeon]
MKYRDYVIKRLLFVIPILFGVSFVTWFLCDISGDPIAAYVGNPMFLSDEEVEAIRLEYGLDQPWYTRFSKHFTHLLQGEWGTTGLYFGYRPVFDVILGYFPPTIELGIVSMIIALALGIPLGIISAMKKDQKTDKFVRGTYLIGYSVPVYYLGMLVSYIIFQTTLEIGVGLNDRSLIGTVPYGGRYNSHVFSYPSHILFRLFPSTGLLLIDSLLAPNPFLFIDASFRILLPGSVIAISQIAIISRMTRMAMIETMKEDFILLAR